jgi:predicted transposase YbfD/YdcC
MAKQALSLVECFQGIEDPRVERTKKHLLMDILCLAVIAVIGGAEGWEEIEEFGKQKKEWLKKYLHLPNGIPSHDTISRLFRRVQPEAFQQCFAQWIESIQERTTDAQQIAIDGKTLRRSHDRKTMKSALHSVCAWSVENHLVLGQQGVHEKSNEITAIPKLLKMLELKGAIVTIDAMGCQKKIASDIVRGGGDYVLAVKKNQPKLYAAIEKHFDDLEEGNLVDEKCRQHTTQEKNRGRREVRHYIQSPLPESMLDIAIAWSGLLTIGKATNRTIRNGKETEEVRYFICSLKLGVQRFASAVRGHWGIENSLHWTLDMTFREDESRIRKDHGPENFASLRRFAISVIKQDTSAGSIRRKRKRAAWNNKALEMLLKLAT